MPNSPGQGLPLPREAVESSLRNDSEVGTWKLDYYGQMISAQCVHNRGIYALALITASHEPTCAQGVPLKVGAAVSDSESSIPLGFCCNTEDNHRYSLSTMTRWEAAPGIEPWRYVRLGAMQMDPNKVTSEFRLYTAGQRPTQRSVVAQFMEMVATWQFDKDRVYAPTIGEFPG